MPKLTLLAPRRRGCEVIAAEFAWFSQRCGALTRRRVIDESGVWHAACRSCMRGVS